MTGPQVLPYAVVTLDGTALAPEIAALLVEIRVRDSLRLPDQALLRLADPRLEHVDQGVLAVGQTIQIECAAPGSQQSTSIFQGKIWAIELELVGDGAFIAATAYEPAFALHQNRRTQMFQDMSPSDVAQKVISGAGLSASVEPSTAAAESYPLIVQNNETDWQLLWRLAARIDYDVAGDGSIVRFAPAGNTGAEESIALAAPDQLISFRPRLSGAQQASTIGVNGWDLTNAQSVAAQGTPPDADSKPAGFARSTIAAPANSPTWTVGDDAITKQSEADVLAKSIGAQIGNGWVEADGVTAGDPRLKAGCLVDVSGVGEKFGGTYKLTSATHTLVGGRGYQTHFTISGRNPRTLLDLVDTAPVAPVWGTSMVVGVVTQTEDPEGMGRVRVKHPALGDLEGTWARIASPAAGSNRGLLMMPVAGDEVVLGFEQGDPRRPYVLGAVWNGQAKPQDLVKSDGSFALASDHDVTVTATGQTNVTAQDAMTLNGKSVSVQATQGSLEVKGTTVTIQSDGTVTIKGQAISVEAGGSLSLKSSGIVQVSGAQVMLG
jgi:phage protein D